MTVTLSDIAARDWAMCVRCGFPVMYGWHSVHHRVLGNRSDNRPSNLILLCGSGNTGCHGWVHHHPRAAKDEGGWIVSRHAPQTTLTVPVLYAQPLRTGWQMLDDELGMRERPA